MYPALSRALGRFFALAVVASLGGCMRPLPEPESAGAQLYVRRCGSCHVAHHPHGLTKKMWEVMVVRMGIEIMSAGQPPLSEEESAAILAYVQRYASNADPGPTS